MSIATISFYILAIKPNSELGKKPHAVLMFYCLELIYNEIEVSGINAAHHCSPLVTCVGFIAWREAAACVLVGEFCLVIFTSCIEYSLKCWHPGIWTMEMDVLSVP